MHNNIQIYINTHKEVQKHASIIHISPYYVSVYYKPRIIFFVLFRKMFENMQNVVMPGLSQSPSSSLKIVRIVISCTQ